VLNSAGSVDADATVTLDGDLPAVDVVADEMLGAVFRSLLQNALVHSDRPSVTVSTTVDDDTVRVAVADDRPGVPDDRKAEILAEGVAGEKTGSTGIGLHLVSRLVDSYDGSLCIEDNDSRGAVSIVELQVAG
jgi:two-component system aerobic respiration control sensor histidine kinase ArcB